MNTEELVNIIANVGVVGGCGDVCGKLPNKLESTACDLLCDYVGIEEFVKILQKTDPDAVYICQLLSVCSHNPDSAAKIDSFSVSPNSGAQGTTFSIDLFFTVTNATGAGEIAIGIQPPNGEGFGDGQLEPGFAAGSYKVAFNLQAKPSEQQPFSPGTYQVEAAICDGECGAIHPYTKTLATGQTSFTITQ